MVVEENLSEDSIVLKQETGKQFMKYSFNGDDKPFTFRNMKVKNEGKETFLKSEGFYPNVDIVEGSFGTKIVMELPGVSKQNLKMTISKNIISIQATKDKPYEGYDKVKKVEIKYGGVLWKFEHTHQIVPSEVKRSFQDGLLIIELPKGDEEEVELSF